LSTHDPQVETPVVAQFIEIGQHWKILESRKPTVHINTIAMFVHTAALIKVPWNMLGDSVSE